MQASGPIGYVCAEYGIEDKMPIYAGGLGVLAGDLVLEAGQNGVPFYAVGLLYHEKVPDPIIFGFTLLPIEIPITISSDSLKIQVWQKKYGTANLYLLSCAEITKTLYGPDDLTMFKQQMILGFGAVALFKLLNISPTVWHLNEGHTAMTMLALAIDFLKINPQLSLQDALIAVGQKIVATKHTILPAAGLHLNWEAVKPLLSPILNFEDLIPLASHDKNPALFSTTEMLLRFVKKASAVSVIHADYEKAIHSDSRLFPITNGVNKKRWQSPDDKNSNRKKLLDYLAKNFQAELNPQALTLVWARRFAAYKRPGLLFSDPERLAKIVNIPDKPLQIIVAGKPHPADFEAQQIARGIEEMSRRPELFRKIIFIPQYDLEIAHLLTTGADVWINTPMPGQEASGTSGMKAGLNGTLQLTTVDGWIAEVKWDGIGWVLPEENLITDLYDTIEHQVIPCFYDKRDEWTDRMAKTRGLVEEKYTTKRVIEEYLEKLYQ